MNFLSEHISFNNANAIVESVDGKDGKNLYMKGIFIQGNIRNHNQRVYPIHEIKKAVDDINDRLANGYSVCGEIDHPAELNINLDRVSHMITEMSMDGANGVGKLKILPTPMGNIAKTLLESGVKLGVSSRGSGNVDDSGTVSDFQIVTVDLVMNPSGPAAYPTSVYEALQHRRGGEIKKLSEAMVHDNKAQKYLRDELLKFIDSLK